ncbi:MAG TPA: carboxypeptidase regulatory-like domain-containing protein [Longimicrobiales bacterium]|nr:carboxypeptidase regulatory-like domain-containing protein [Longimicrobiales bacterium]
MKRPLALGCVAAALLVIEPPAPATAQQAGWIEGRVEVQRRAPRRTANRYPGAGAASRPVQPVPRVAYIEGRVGPPAAPDRAAPEMAQRDTAFGPPVMVVPMGASVEFPNRDPFFHNVFSYSAPKRFDLGRYPRGESKAVRFDEPGVVKIYCEVHEFMRAAVIVTENPFHAIVEEDGSFRIDGLPPGRHTLVLWDVDADEKRSEVTVRAGEASRVRIRLD